MTVKEELTLLTKGYSRVEIKEMKEREKAEAGETPAEEPKVEEPKVEEQAVEEPAVEEPNVENVSRETSEQDNRIKELETQLAKVQEENAHRDNSGEVDTRSDFDKCVDIFKGSF